MRDTVATTVSLVYLARLREAFGTSHETHRAAGRRAHGRRVASMAGRTRRRLGASSLRPDRAVRFAVNHELAQSDTPIGAGDEVALFPPVTGG